MDKLIKFLHKLSEKDKLHLMKEIFPKIQILDLEGLQVKQLETKVPQFTIKYKKIRIIFKKEDNKGKIVLIGLRKDVYKKLK